MSSRVYSAGFLSPLERKRERERARLSLFSDARASSVCCLKFPRVMRADVRADTRARTSSASGHAILGRRCLRVVGELFSSAAEIFEGIDFALEWRRNYSLGKMLLVYSGVGFVVPEASFFTDANFS